MNDNSFPLYKSLTQQILLLGAPRRVVILNFAIAAILLLSFKTLYVLPLNLVIHIGAVYITKFDEQFFDCLHRYLSKKSFYGV